MSRALRSYYPWYGDMELAGHLIDWLGLGTLGVAVIFLAAEELHKASTRLRARQTADTPVPETVS